MTPTGQRKQHRFTTCDGKRFTVTTRSNSTEAGKDGTVVDLSTGGARLALRSPVVVGEQIDIGLHAAALKFEEYRRATVCWTALTRDLLWHTGIHFDEPLDSAAINVLARAGVIERRQSNRVKVSIKATARLETSRQLLAVRIADVSPDGLGLVSPVSMEPDRRVMIKVDSPLKPWSVLAHVRSCSPHRRGYVIGCEFADHDIYRHVWQLICAKQQPVPKSSWGRIRDCAFGAVSAFLCMTLMTPLQITPEITDAPAWEQHTRQADSQQIERLEFDSATLWR